MIELSREIRFALVRPEISVSAQPVNSWGGWPATNHLAPQLKLKAVVQGPPDPETGYVCNVAVLDQVLRSIVTQCLIPTYGNSPSQCSAETMIAVVASEFTRRWQLKDKLVRLTLELSSRLSFSIDLKRPAMIELTQQYEFSAAHRLHCDSMSPSENAAFFGKCNNTHGHGHNYVVDVTVGNSADHVQATGCVIPIEQLHSAVETHVINRLDHKHLNKDVEYFSTVNPSVENIAMAIYQWLDGKTGDAQLISVKVFETPKTWAQYSGA